MVIVDLPAIRDTPFSTLQLVDNIILGTRLHCGMAFATIKDSVLSMLAITIATGLFII